MNKKWPEAADRVSVSKAAPDDPERGTEESHRGRSADAIRLFDAIRSEGTEEEKKNLPEIIRPFANPSCPEALLRMSVVYSEGLGTDMDIDEAITWAKMASDAKYEPGTSKLFDLLFLRNSEGDREGLIEVFKNHDVIRTDGLKIRLARTYLEGYGIEADPSETLRLLKEIKNRNEKWNRLACKAILEDRHRGLDVFDAVSETGLFESDLDSIEVMPSESRGRLLIGLMRTYLGENAGYEDLTGASNDALKTAESDCQALLNLLESKNGAWGTLVHPKNVSKLLNSIVSSCRVGNSLSEEDVKSLFISLDVNDADLKEEHEGLYAFLSMFDKICKTYEIGYFVSCGTLLGACRHHGFIPWDDDVDLYMMREEYAKLEALMRDDKYLRINNSLYQSPIDGRINKAHQMLFKDRSYKYLRVGLIIYDYVRSTDDNGREAYLGYMSNLRKEVDAFAAEDVAVNSNPLEDPRIKDVYRRSEKEFGIVLGGSPRKGVALTFDNPVRHIDRKIFDYGDFFPLKDVRFGPLLLPGPNNPEKILASLYGDYMSFPSNIMDRAHFELDGETSENIKKGIRAIRKVKKSIDEGRFGPNGARTSCRSCSRRPRSACTP